MDPLTPSPTGLINADRVTRSAAKRTLIAASEYINADEKGRARLLEVKTSQVDCD